MPTWRYIVFLSFVCCTSCWQWYLILTTLPFLTGNALDGEHEDYNNANLPVVNVDSRQDVEGKLTPIQWNLWWGADLASASCCTRTFAALPQLTRLTLFSTTLKWAGPSFFCCFCSSSEVLRDFDSVVCLWLGINLVRACSQSNMLIGHFWLFRNFNVLTRIESAPSPYHQWAVCIDLNRSCSILDYWEH